MFAESVKHLAEVKLVLVLVVAKNENIVQIHQNKVVDVAMHYGIHKTLEGTWGVTEPKWQNRIFKQAISRYESRFFTCIRCQSNLVVTTGQVDSTQTHRFRQLIEKVIYPR